MCITTSFSSRSPAPVLASKSEPSTAPSALAVATLTTGDLDLRNGMVLVEWRPVEKAKRACFGLGIGRETVEWLQVGSEQGEVATAAANIDNILSHCRGVERKRKAPSYAERGRMIGQSAPRRRPSLSSGVNGWIRLSR